MAESNSFFEKTKKGVSERIGALRLRTYVFTIILVVMVGLYFVIQTGLKSHINVVDLVFIITIQILTNSAYYPDGKLFGSKDKDYIANKDNYNSKANLISEQRKFENLREYCKVDYERRKQQYIEEECYFIGIDLKMLAELKKKSEKEIKKMKFFDFNGQFVVLNKHKRRKLFNLLFHKLPVEENQPETIMSAYERKPKDNIRNKSVTYDAANYIGNIFKFILIGVFIAYLAVEFQDGVTWESVFKTILCLFTIVSTAVTAFTSGEKSTKVYKKQFYVDLANFIDEFFEWDTKRVIAKPAQIQETETQILPKMELVKAVV